MALIPKYSAAWWKNLYQCLKEQGPPKRFIRNFFITRNAWGMFYPQSHFRIKDGEVTEKVRRSTKAKAEEMAAKMSAKHNKHFHLTVASIVEAIISVKINTINDFNLNTRQSSG